MRAVREKLGLEETGLAALWGCSEAYIKMMEKGSKNVSGKFKLLIEREEQKLSILKPDGESSPMTLQDAPVTVTFEKKEVPYEQYVAGKIAQAAQGLLLGWTGKDRRLALQDIIRDAQTLMDLDAGAEPAQLHDEIKKYAGSPLLQPPPPEALSKLALDYRTMSAKIPAGAPFEREDMLTLLSDVGNVLQHQKKGH